MDKRNWLVAASGMVSMQLELSAVVGTDGHGMCDLFSPIFVGVIG